MAMIIDAHTHLHGSVIAEQRPGGERRFIEAMDQAGIDCAVVAGLDSLDDQPAVLCAARRFPDRVIPFAHVDPNAPRLLEGGWRGIGEIYLPCGAAQLPRDAMGKTAEIARQLGLPILMHTGEYSYTAPLLVGGLARTFPDIPWILGHMGSLRYALDAIELMRQLPNVYADTSGMSAPQILRKAVDAGGAERLLFGSDTPFWDPVVERTRIEAARLDPGIERLILGENAERLLLR